MNYSEIIKKVSGDIDLSPDIVDKSYKAFWEYIRDSIEKLPLKSVSEEEFSKLRTNFNIPSLGKLTCTYDRYLGVKNRFNYIKKLKERDEETN